MTSATASAIRPSLRENRQLSGSPHTPSRFISSSYSSPGSSFRQEDDAIIFELEPRFLKAGFEGESGPQCVLPFGPENGRRVGDYRTWLPNYRRPRKEVSDEAREHELWRHDLRAFDLGLVEDKLEKAVREVYNKYLLTDAGTARLVLVLPSLVPLAVLSSMLTTLFERWKYTTITMLPAPTMCTMAAGLRSALVIDIGWEETVVTPVYEYRELTPCRSTRAMSRLVEEMAKKLASLGERQAVPDGEHLRQDFDFVEDFVSRMAYCDAQGRDANADLSDKVDGLSLEESEKSAPTTVSFDWPCHSTTVNVTINEREISSTVEGVFFGVSQEICHDDQEQPIHLLVYQAFLKLPPDIRGVCMSRITFCGQGESIPGLKERTLKDVEVLMSKHGWNAVRGEKVKPPRQGLAEIAQGRATPADAKHNVNIPPGKDFVDEKLFKQKAKETLPGPQGSLRAIDTLGAWAGASILTSLKVKGVVEVERDRFLSHGLAGAVRDQEVSVIPQRTSTAGVTTKSSDRASWTLGGWG